VVDAVLCFWNFAGVPFLYFAQSAFIFKHAYGAKTYSLFGLVDYTTYAPPDWCVPACNGEGLLCSRELNNTSFFAGRLCIALIVALLATYYVWDTSQSQKNHFRLEFSGVKIERIGWLPWQILKNPKCTWPHLGRHVFSEAPCHRVLLVSAVIATQRGTPLLTDGINGIASRYRARYF
jgi:hypothetical protein